MVASLTQMDILSRALHALANSDPRDFEDLLWLAYGDDWTAVLQSLTQRRLVRYSPSDDAHNITDDGRRVLGMLRKAGHGLQDTATKAG